MDATTGQTTQLTNVFNEIQKAGGTISVDGAIASDAADFLEKLGATDIDAGILLAEFDIVRQNMYERQAPLQWKKLKYVPFCHIKSQPAHPTSPYIGTTWS